MIWRCDLVPQYEALKKDLGAAIEKVLSSGRYTLGPHVAEFENRFSDYVGCKHGVGVNSGTDALMLALWCFDLKAGDEIITTVFTAIPTYSAIRHVGAKPVFVDIDPDTFLMDLNQVSEALTPQTRAIVPVHLFGNVVDIERLREIVGSDVLILEDCAQCHGATIRGKMTGSLGDIAAFSFYPTKNLGAFGDGGMVVTDRGDWAEQIKLRRMHGMINKDEFVTDGINSRLDELQAAILTVKLRYLDQWNENRIELANAYISQLDPDLYAPQKIDEAIRHVYHVFSVLVNKGNRDALVRHLEQRGIQTNIYYPHKIPDQVGFRASFQERHDLASADSVKDRIIALPMYPEMPPYMLEIVVKAMGSF